MKLAIEIRETQHILAPLKSSINRDVPVMAHNTVHTVVLAAAAAAADSDYSLAAE